MLEAALADGSGHRQCRLRGLRPTTARRPPVRRGRGHWAHRGRLVALPFRRAGTRGRGPLPRRRDCAVVADLPVLRRHRRLPRGRAVLPRVAHSLGPRDVRRMCPTRDAVLSILNTTARFASGRRPDGQRGGRPPDDRDGLAPRPRSPPSRAPRRVSGGLRTPPRISKRYAGTASPCGHQRPRLHAPATDDWCPRTKWAPSGRRSRRSGVGTTLLVDTYDITRGVENAVAAAGTGLGGVRSTRAISACSRVRSASSSTASGRQAPGSWCPGTWTSMRSPRCRAETVATRYGVGTSLVTDRVLRPPGWSKNSSRSRACGREAQQQQAVRGGHQTRERLSRASGTIAKRCSYRAGAAAPDTAGLESRELLVPMVRSGELVDELPTLDDARALLARTW